MSGIKGRAPGAVVNEEEIVIPDGSVFPLNLDPHGGELQAPQIQNGVRTFLSLGAMS